MWRSCGTSAAAVSGESREQEASAKIADAHGLIGPDADGIRWHMVGQIQSNKAKAVAAWADTVHSVSTAKVVAALDRACAGAGRRTSRTPLRVFVQISLDGDCARGESTSATRAPWTPSVRTWPNRPDCSLRG